MLVVFRQPDTDSSAESRLVLFTAAISRGSFEDTLDTSSLLGSNDRGEERR